MTITEEMASQGRALSFKYAIRASRFGQWLLNRALDNHRLSPCQHHFGPARCSFAGWVYFRVLCGIPRQDGTEATHGIMGWGV